MCVYYLSLKSSEKKSKVTHHSVGPTVIPPQSIMKSFLHAIPIGILGIVLEFLTIQRGPPDDASRWANNLK